MTNPQHTPGPKNWTALASALQCSEDEAVDYYQSLRRACSGHIVDDRKQSKLDNMDRILSTKATEA